MILKAILICPRYLSWSHRFLKNIQQMVSYRHGFSSCSNQYCNFRKLLTFLKNPPPFSLWNVSQQHHFVRLQIRYMCDTPSQVSMNKQETANRKKALSTEEVVSEIWYKLGGNPTADKLKISQNHIMKNFDRCTLTEIVQCLKETGCSLTKVVELLIKSPETLVNPIQKWTSTLTFLSGFGFQGDHIINILKTSPGIVSKNAKDIQQCCKNMRDLGFREKNAVSIIGGCPNVIYLQLTDMSSRLEKLGELFSFKDVLNIVEKSPNVLTDTWDDVKYKFHYVHFIMGIEQYEMMATCMFSYPIEHIRARHEFLYRSGLYVKPDKTDKAKLINPNFKNILDTSNHFFACNVAQMNQNDYETFFELFKKEKKNQPLERVTDDESSDDERYVVRAPYLKQKVNTRDYHTSATVLLALKGKETINKASNVSNEKTRLMDDDEHALKPDHVSWYDKSNKKLQIKSFTENNSSVNSEEIDKNRNVIRSHFSRNEKNMVHKSRHNNKSSDEDIELFPGDDDDYIASDKSNNKFIGSTCLGSDSEFDPEVDGDFLDSDRTEVDSELDSPSETGADRESNEGHSASNRKQYIDCQKGATPGHSPTESDYFGDSELTPSDTDQSSST